MFNVDGANYNWIVQLRNHFTLTHAILQLVLCILYVFSCLSALLPVAEGHGTQALRDLQNALDDNETKLLFQVR